MTRYIKLTQGKRTSVDDSDYEYLNQWKWCYDAYNGYVVRGRPKGYDEKSAPIKMHNVIMNPPQGKEVDHKDRNRLRNTRKNLRIATRTQNNANHRIRCDNTSGYKGVVWDKDRQQWRAQISVHRKMKNLGRFGTKLAAVKAYRKAAREAFGEFCRF